MMKYLLLLFCVLFSPPLFSSTFAYTDPGMTFNISIIQAKSLEDAERIISEDSKGWGFEKKIFAACKNKGWYTILNVKQMLHGERTYEQGDAGSCGHLSRNDAEMAALKSCYKKPLCHELLYIVEDNYHMRSGITMLSRYDDGVSLQSSEVFMIHAGGSADKYGYTLSKNIKGMDAILIDISFESFLKRYDMPFESN